MEILNQLNFFLDQNKLCKKHFFYGLIFTWILKHYKDVEFNVKIQNLLNTNILPKLLVNILYVIENNPDLSIDEIIKNMDIWLQSSKFYETKYTILINIDREYYHILMCNDDNLELLSRFLITDYPITKKLYDNIIFNKEDQNLSELCRCFVYLELIEETIELFDLSDEEINMKIDLLTFQKIINRFNELYNKEHIVIVEKLDNNYEIFSL
jgi:hypothetical protein